MMEFMLRMFRTVFSLGILQRGIFVWIISVIQSLRSPCLQISGNLALNAYKEDCEFAEPAGSLRGLSRFKRNCTNFGLLIEKSNMKPMKWEDLEDNGFGHWRFSCFMSFPWKPILSATGHTEYYCDIQIGKVCRHVEHWKVPYKAISKQLLKPSRGLWHRKTGG